MLVWTVLGGCFLQRACACLEACLVCVCECIVRSAKHLFIVFAGPDESAFPSPFLPNCPLQLLPPPLLSLLPLPADQRTPGLDRLIDVVLTT